MIKTFKSKALNELFTTGKSSKIDAKLAAKIIERLDVLNRASDLRALDLPGYVCHPLKQFKPWRYAIRVTGAWRITFEWDKGNAESVDFEQYH